MCLLLLLDQNRNVDEEGALEIHSDSTASLPCPGLKIWTWFSWFKPSLKMRPQESQAILSSYCTLGRQLNKQRARHFSSHLALCTRNFFWQTTWRKCRLREAGVVGCAWQASAIATSSLRVCFAKTDRRQRTVICQSLWRRSVNERHTKHCTTQWNDASYYNTKRYGLMASSCVPSLTPLLLIYRQFIDNVDILLMHGQFICHFPFSAWSSIVVCSFHGWWMQYFAS